MGQILEINKDENNVVRSMKLLISETRSSFTSHILEWSISNLVLLVDAENNMWFPNEEPKVIYQDVLASWGEPVEEAMWWRNVKLFWHCFFKKKTCLFQILSPFKLFWWNFVYASSCFEFYCCILRIFKLDFNLFLSQHLVDKLLLYHLL